MEDRKWSKAAEEEIAKIHKKIEGKKDAEGKVSGQRALTEAEKEVIKAIEYSVSKVGFDVGIRAIYTAPSDVFVGGNAAGIVGGFRNYNSNNLNGFKPARSPDTKYPWQDRKKKKLNAAKQDMVDAYKRRAYFYKPYKRPYMVLNTEELATIFHFPGGVLATPTFARIGSKKAEAPSNLPL
jgi:hypothetical protein